MHNCGMVQDPAARTYQGVLEGSRPTADLLCSFSNLQVLVFSVRWDRVTLTKIQLFAVCGCTCFTLVSQWRKGDIRSCKHVWLLSGPMLCAFMIMIGFASDGLVLQTCSFFQLQVLCSPPWGNGNVVADPAWHRDIIILIVRAHGCLPPWMHCVCRVVHLIRERYVSNIHQLMSVAVLRM